jgi:hypothetical protein
MGEVLVVRRSGVFGAATISLGRTEKSPFRKGDRLLSHFGEDP